MNIDLLKKLTRLANSNPNDNEANLAARKVCKMLEECNWVLKEEVKTAASKVGIRNYGDVRRSEESFWKAKPQEPRKPNPAQDKVYQDINDFLRNFAASGFNPWVQERPDFTSYHTKREAPRPEKRILKCTECGKEKETGYVGNLYVCSDCQWNEYRRKTNQDTINPRNYGEETRWLECSRCHKPVETRFIGGIFICADCQEQLDDLKSF